MDYKATIHLPSTDFPMKANLPQREPELLARWQSLGLYGRLRSARSGAAKFVLHDGPPYANGAIHIGHAVNKILKDIIVKAKTLDGFDAPYVPGWDCHGLPIELMVEKKIGKPGVKASIPEFRAACRRYAGEQVQLQREDFIRLGVLGDWENSYLTMDFRYEADIVRALSRILEQGHLLKGAKPVHWCTDCGSALAEAEVEYENKRSVAIDVRFAAVSANDILARCHTVPGHTGQGDLSVVIWTTTPWTLPANQAVALNPDLEYAVVQLESEPERLVVAEALLKETMARYGIEDYRVIAYCKGAALEGVHLQHPFLDRTVPIIMGGHVTLEAGTGAVHTAPGHGQEDYAVGQRYGLPVENPVGDDGRFLPSTEYFAGLHVLQANQPVIEVLKAHRALVHEAALEHSYPHCWRHKTPVIFRATPQWFIAMEQNGLREQALRAIDGCDWIPNWGQARIAGMVEHRPDWCISRQRTWGVPLAVFVHRETGALHPATPALLEAVAKLIEQRGIDAWFDLDPAELLGSDAEHYRKITDTLDVWFDSGVSHFAVLQQRDDLRFPADLYLEGSDQHRGWFQSSLLAAVAGQGSTPYKAVLTHGFTVDADGKKMSKSKGNVVAPQKVVSSLGADILRLWVAATDYQAEMSVSDEILKRTTDVYRRIRNTARYLLANLNGFDPNTDRVANGDLLALDAWAVSHTQAVQAEIVQAYGDYQFHRVHQLIHQFCSVDLGSFYLDILKDRQYTCQGKSLARRSGQTAMYHIAEALVRWLAPIASFTAEEIWQYLPGARSESVFLETWYAGLSSRGFAPAEPFDPVFWAAILAVREAVSKELEKLRVAGGIGASLDAVVELYASDQLLQQLNRFQDELRFVFIASEASANPLGEAPDNAVTTDLAGLKVRVAASPHGKCVRCWHHRADVGLHAEHPELCGRCVCNVAGAGETRRFA